jgi:hypothetical protein
VWGSIGKIEAAKEAGVSLIAYTSIANAGRAGMQLAAEHHGTEKALPVEQYREVLVGAGLPEGYAAILADSDLGIARGDLLVTSGDLSTLIGRPSTPMREAVRTAISAVPSGHNA